MSSERINNEFWDNSRLCPKVFLMLGVVVFLAAGCSRQAQSPTPGTKLIVSSAYNYSHRLQIDGQSLMVEVATSTAAMQQGLSDRLTMENNQGMLFDFGQVPSTSAFWMKDMKFGLDFIWIADGKIVGITPDVPAPAAGTKDNELTLYSPPLPINEVLEVNAGWAEKSKIKTGSDVRLLY